MEGWFRAWDWRDLFFLWDFELVDGPCMCINSWERAYKVG